MKTCVLAVVLMVAVGAIGAGPATGPAKPLEGMREVVARVPKELWPDNRGWTELQQRAANEWAAVELVGLPVKIRGVVESIQTDDGAKVVLRPDDFQQRGHKVKASVSLVVPNPTDSQIIKMRPGDRVAGTGVIAEVAMSIGNPYGNFADALMVGVELHNVRLDSRP